MLGVASLVTRRTASGLVVGPGQRLGVLDALAVYTAGSAHATGDGAVRGRLKPGRLADFVVLGADLTAVAPDEIASVPVRSTWVGGSRVWSAD